MKAYVITRYGGPHEAFELQEKPDPKPGAGEVAIEVEAFGLNYADIMARTGRYRDAPPLPAIVGYEAMGRVAELGEGVQGLTVGQRVAAFTRFGGYATRVVAPEAGVVPIPEDMEPGVALALTVQYCTAYHVAEHVTTMFEGDHVLVQAAAGGVGTALVQLAKRRGCIVYGTAGSAEKLKYLRELGVDHPINYREENFYEKIKAMRGKQGIDKVFDSLGGKAFKQGYKLLGPGGTIVGFGNASRSNSMRNVFGDLKTLFGFGFYSAAFVLVDSKAVVGVNMLRIADHKPAVLKQCLEAVVALAAAGEVKPTIGAEFSHDKLGDAHEYVATRKSIGKVFVKW